MDAPARRPTTGRPEPDDLTLLSRLAADRAALRERFAVEGELTGLTRLGEAPVGDPRAGDPHTAGPQGVDPQAVGPREAGPEAGAPAGHLLQFANGTRIVYQPRPLDDLLLRVQDLLDRLNPQLRLPLLQLPLLARDGYGWRAHLATEAPRSQDELQTFHHRVGTLAAVLHLLAGPGGGRPVLVAVRDQPVLVDPGAAHHPGHPAHPDQPGDRSAAERLARHDLRHSVLRSGLLPTRSRQEAAHTEQLAAGFTEAYRLLAAEQPARLDPADLDRELWLLRLAVSTADGPVEPRRRPTVLVTERLAGPPPTAAGLRERALAKALAAAEELLRAAYRSGDPVDPVDLAWLGPTWAAPGRWTPAELGPDLYSGTAGVLLFLHQLGRVSGDADLQQAARGAELTLHRQLRRTADRLGGGLAGTGGVLYALAQLAADRPGDREVEAAADLMLRRVAATAAADSGYDLLAGNAGTIGGLLAWGAVRPSGAVTDAVARCARHLAAAGRVQSEGGTGWPTAGAGRPLAGFAHGGSGIGWALAKAGELLGEARLAELALDALDHERTLFDPKAANWRDARVADGPPSYPVLWCHGAAGIALARVELAELLDNDLLRKERDIALETVVRHGFGLDFSLCHGDFGNLEPLLLAGEPWHTVGVRRAASTLDALDERGWVCGLPQGLANPSLLVGLAGIGHGLLRLAAPADVPALLALHPPIPR
ncbi:lanthionine synthetase LanC family protein [Streptomyces tateyamensis]|uniref:lanthionine synthetase LanC family protein n=1 Tax=Streptomyces tateyamensis TaxID=565073 RepID=UPI0011B4D01A|nr:lanthionine synthetase LanC family protein [Streptomyces tateyamensis]